MAKPLGNTRKFCDTQQANKLEIQSISYFNHHMCIATATH